VNVVISQALATGLPVIATRHSGLPEQVEDASNGYLVDEGDYTTLADRIVFFIEHSELWSAMSRHAREHVAKHYDSKALIEEQVDWYEKVACSRSSTE
jgi:colanic acid/amylovoran biosynthesis glycosyltransferase